MIEAHSTCNTKGSVINESTMVMGITKGCKICFTNFNYKYLRNNELVLGTFKDFYAWLGGKILT